MHFPKLSEVHPLVWIILFALILRVGLALLMPLSFGHTGGTFEYNLSIAESLVSGEGFGETLYIAPGFPVVLALLDLVTETSVMGVRMLQILLQVLLIVGTYVLTTMVTSRKNISLIAAAIMAAYPILLLHVSSQSPDILFSTLFLFSCIALLKALYEKKIVYALGAGVLMALAALTDPFWLYLPIAILLWCGAALVALYRKKKAFPDNSKKIGVYMGVFVVSFVIVLTPWVARNIHVFGSIDNSPFVQKQIEREAFRPHNFNKMTSIFLPQGWPTLAMGLREMAVVPYGLDAFHPYAEVSYRSAAVELIQTGHITSQEISGPTFMGKFSFALIYWILMLFALIGVWKYRKHAISWLATLILLYAIFTVGSLGILKGFDGLSPVNGFFFHMTPFLALFAAIGMSLLVPDESVSATNPLIYHAGKL